MKKSVITLIAVAILISFSSCGVNYAWMLNTNNNTTQVSLTRNNFRFVEKVKGSADVSYVFVFGGSKKKQLYNNAYANMLEKANLSGSKALVNIVTEEHVGGVPPFYYTRTVTVSASVIEFNE
jgi:hypothetical protein